MDCSEATRIVFNRIQKFEPENVTKIVGFLLLKDDGKGEVMIRLAFSSDQVLYKWINTAKLELAKPGLSGPISPPMKPAPISNIPPQFSPFSPPAKFHVPTPYWDPQLPMENNQDFVPVRYPDELQNQTQFLSLDDQFELVNSGLSGFSNEYYYPEGALRGTRRSPSLHEFPVKSCHYFNKGFCKHGSNCRYFHGQAIPESFAHMFGPNSNEFLNEDQLVSPGRLEQLELEISELLKSRRGHPVSIASLPMVYYEKYGKVLQGDGYLTESQRHGKVGYSLTKLLARLKNSIRLIDRPHGQHAVVLAEDAPKYMEYRSERNDPGPIVSGSRQIYLTFPAESTFTEEDVSNYFNTFGSVEDVRIPCQQKRMFGFVTFVSADTVKMILAKGNPHFVCGARVLVKPYREKLKVADRKYPDKIEAPMYFPSHYIDMDSELNLMARGSETSRLLRKQFIEDQEQSLEHERKRLAELQLVRRPLGNQPCFGYCIDDLKVSEDHSKFPSAEQFNYLLDVLNSNSISDDKSMPAGSNYAEHESSQGLNLPESPFASPMASSISTVI